MKLRPFELTLVVIFVILILLTLLFLSGYKPKKDNGGLPEIGKITIWGTLPKDAILKEINDLSKENQGYKGVTYKEVNSENFDAELVNAIADGKGPDVIIASHEHLVTLRNKIKPVSYDVVSLRDVKSAYVDGAEIFALDDGLYAYPLMVDPLMLYWNKNILATDNLLEAPKTWESLVNDYLPTLVRRDHDRSITRAVIAMGEYQNVKNAFGVFSMLLLQAGSEGVATAPENTYKINLDQSPEKGVHPLLVSADFYTRFSKPSNSLYTWNRSFSSDKDKFLSEDLALYFGYGSEAHEIEKQNPNLSFDIAEVPQGAAATVRRTYGKIYGLSALKTSDNLVGAQLVMQDLSNKDNSEKIAQLYNMVPALRASVAVGNSDTYGHITYQSAAVAFGWLSIRQEKINEIFTTMTQDINENRHDTTSAVNDALGRLKLEYN
jgi:ABC-type glycerol-3-phosphate transport system substrate-binding protein